MKRRALGTLSTPYGKVEIKNKTIARALEESQELARLASSQHAQLQTARAETADYKARLAQLQNHWWVRFGELFGVVKVSW